MFDALLEGITGNLVEICALALTAMLGYVGTRINGFLKSKNLDSVAKTVVKWTEQVYTDIHGKEKLEKALTKASLLLAEKGIKVSEEELMVAIEAACYELKINLTK